MAAKTNHSGDIQTLRTKAEATKLGLSTKDSLVFKTAADLLELHDRQSFSLDKWKSARTLVEVLIGHPIQENHV